MNLEYRKFTYLYEQYAAIFACSPGLPESDRRTRRGALRIILTT